MGTVFEMPMTSETLSVDELVVITGAGRKGDQVRWLSSNGWVYHTNRAGVPVVGRLYARLKLSGINPGRMSEQAAWNMPMGKVR